MIGDNIPHRRRLEKFLPLVRDSYRETIGICVHFYFLGVFRNLKQGFCLNCGKLLLSKITIINFLIMMNLSEILETVKKLVELRIKIAFNKITNDISTIVIRVVVLIMMVLASMFVLLFSSISLAFYFGELLDSVYLGFLSVGGIYLLLLLILYLIRNTLSFQTRLKGSLTKFIFLFKAKPVR